nr:CatB-related O-acetyltransferase [Kibdelosporangium sp. MJ126-NF4]CTQ90951.1 Chloramphenicol acetyltransferase (EC 2.3.1.28) [Kibdelosporangium sp. MJ126-NF4]
MAAPDPDRLYPDAHGPNAGLIKGDPQVVFLKTLVQSPLTEVGDYTYYADPDDPTGFERRNVLFHYGPDRLVIGKFCALARGIRFIMGAANHRRNGVSTYPFPMFGGDWLEHMPLFAARDFPGDTVIGNDVWLGYDVTVLPGVRIGHGAIVAAKSVVAADIPPYAIAGGNPATVIRSRFAAAEVAELLRLAWWDWPIDVISEHIPAIMGGSVRELAAVRAR